MRTCAATIRQYWNKFLNLNSRSKYTSVFVIAIALVGIFLVPHIAHAELDMTSISNAIILALTRFFLWIASFLIQLSLFFLKFFILLAGYNGFINASVVKFGWNIIRDVANMFFIVILLVIAFGTILGLEQYEWKKSLPKLVFAAIFVNFSNVICQLIIDVSQVFTITFLNAVAGTAGGNFINMMNFREVLAFATTKPDGNADIAGDLLIGALFALFMCFVAAAAIGSYLIVMLFRMVTLWCLIILSPLAFLFSVLPSTQSYAEEFWKEFVNHVIAAPMMVFFLWLSFATFGAGNITESLQGPENNSLSDYKIDDDSSNVGEQTGVSINKAASWMNLANFAVAIGFLMIGMERVQKLGVKGGDWISKAEGFAKNSFQIASGISLARMGSDKVIGGVGAGIKGGAGFAVGALGGNFVKRKAQNVYNKTRALGSSINIARDTIGQRVEKELLGKTDASKTRRLLGKVAAGAMGVGTLGMFKSERRAEKESENWAKLADSRKKRHEEEISTSYTAGGQANLTESVKLEIAEEKSAAGKNLKFAQRRKDLLGQGSHDDSELSKAYGKGKWAAIAHDTAEAEAKTANITEQQHTDHARHIAEERAKAYRADGQELKAEAIERSNSAHITEENNKLFAPLQQGEFVAKSNEIVSQLQSGMKNGVAITPEQRNKLIQQATSIMATATAKDAETGVNTFRSMLKASGWTDDITDDNRTQAMLSALTGKIVLPGKEEDARDSVRDAFGDEKQYNEAMRNMFASFNRAASQGATMFGGMVTDGVGADGKSRYDVGSNVGEFDKYGNLRGSTASPGTRNYAADKGFTSYFAERLPISSVQTAADLGASNTAGDLVGMSAAQSANFGAMFKGKDRRSISQSVQASFYKSLNKANLKNATGGIDSTKQMEFAQMYNEVARNVADNEAFFAFVDSTKELWAALGMPPATSSADTQAIFDANHK